MLTVYYFAGLRESLGVAEQSLELPEGADTVDALARHLAATGDDAWAVLRDGEQVLVAVDQTIVQRDHPLRGHEEVAFFPPMTGG